MKLEVQSKIGGEKTLGTRNPENGDESASFNLGALKPPPQMTQKPLERILNLELILGNQSHGFS